MKRLLVCFFSLVAMQVKSQEINPYFSAPADSSAKRETGIFAGYSAGSNAITNGFINSFYLGQFINNSQKQEVESRLHASNRLGGDADGGIYYMQKIDSYHHHKINASWFVAIKSRQHADFSFSKDLFKVCFEGNDGYRGQTADFSGFQMNVMQYQQFQAGFMGKYFGFSLSVYNGSQYQMLQAKTAQLYTSPMGDYLDFNANYAMTVSNPSNSQPFANNGLGTGLDLYARVPICVETKHAGQLYFEVSDLGFIRWNKKTDHYGNDTLYHFDGIAINNAFQVADSSIHYSAKSILNAKVNSQSAYTAPLPASFHVCYIPDGETYQIVPGIRYRVDANYIPYEYVQVRYHIRKYLTLNAELGYGGYAGFQTGLSVQTILGRGFQLKAGTSNFLGYAFPAFTCGQGAFVSISKVFR
ncbi:MAG TPA: DUF5723 family protein [Bacteroidia bacterium]|nr:DUF5723 family protein [Bacteroidia bacterium]